MSLLNLDLNFDIFKIFNFRPYITLSKLIDNPSGKKHWFSSDKNISLVKAKLTNNFFILLKTKKNFEHKIYKDGDNYYFWFKIPSESYDLFYDVVLQFVPKDATMAQFKNISEYSINFFSNSPDMMFKYTYVLHDAKLTISALVTAGKYSKIALSEKPKITNPVGEFGFEKSVYYAALYIDKNKDLISKDYLDHHCERPTITNFKNFIKGIVSQPDKLIEYKEKKEEYLKALGRKRKKKITKEQIAEIAYKQNMAIHKAKLTKNKSQFKSVFTKKK